MRNLIRAIVIAALLCPDAAEAARNFQLKGKNELSGGIGFQAGLSDWAPGGFKWFNDYSRELSQLVWFNVQLNVVAGGGGWTYRCKYDRWGNPYDCRYGSYFGGNALETAAGVKLKWRLRNIPLQIHAKLGGILNGLFFSGDYKGVALGFRGGAGVRYFFVPTFGVGAELVNNFGPAFITHPFEDTRVRFYATFDFNMGVEWRF